MSTPVSKVSDENVDEKIDFDELEAELYFVLLEKSDYDHEVSSTYTKSYESKLHIKPPLTAAATFTSVNNIEESVMSASYTVSKSNTYVITFIYFIIFDIIL